MKEKDKEFNERQADTNRIDVEIEREKEIGHINTRIKYCCKRRDTDRKRKTSFQSIINISSSSSCEVFTPVRFSLPSVKNTHIQPFLQLSFFK